MAEETVRFVAVSCKVKLANLLEGFDLKIVAECAILSLATVTPLVKLTSLRLEIFAGQAE